MSRAVLLLVNDLVRDRAIKWIRRAPAGTRLTFQEAKRTLPQNSLLWAALTDVASQTTHCGRRYSPDEWKILFMHALGREIEFIPSLDEKTFLPIGLSSSDLSKSEMTDLIESIFAWGAEHGIKFGGPKEEESAS
jgi:hypothetical protein